jgi:hypothetical protein
MKITNKNKKNTTIILLIISAVLLLSAGVFAYVVQRSAETDTTSQDTNGRITEEQVKDIEDKPASPSNEEDTKTQPVQEDPTVTKPVQPRILSAYQEGEMVRVSADFTVTAGGTCRLTLSKPGQADIVETAEIIVVPSGYACNGFLVKVPSQGNWTASVVHIENSVESEAATSRVGA